MDVIMSADKNLSTKKPNATAIHVKDGDVHLVGIGNLRVVLVQDGNAWFAQGLDIDYAAEGATLESVKNAFETGFCCTIHEHLRVYGKIDKFLKPAPVEVWKEMLYDQLANLSRFSQVSVHTIAANVVTYLPFNGIQYIQREKIAA